MTDGEDNFESVNPENYYRDEFVRANFNRSKYSYTMESTFATVLVEHNECTCN